MPARCRIYTKERNAYTASLFHPLTRTAAMRAEPQKMVESITEALALLRRHL